MTSRRIPRLALALLERLAPDSTALAGDLVEEFEQGRRTRAWFWWQVLTAIIARRSPTIDVIRPLQLVDLQPSDASERSRRLKIRFEPVNLTASPVHGVGGLGIVALSLLVTVIVPGLWGVLVGSTLAGLALGVLLIVLRRRRIEPSD
jgi:hypothetical protein